MSNDGVRIIEEYLQLVREKLPESIADDVITELETYMMETATEFGESGQITTDSAKKVVAQFGAPGEVADEYKFSMLPETIPKDDILQEIIHDFKEQEVDQRITETKETPNKELGVDPTTSYSTFFFKTLTLTIICVLILSTITLFVGPVGNWYWLPNWQFIMFAIETCLVVLILLGQTMILKRNRKILWKRSYPEWSTLQKLMTLPENSFPEGSNFTRKIDMLVTLAGFLLCAPMVLQWYQGWIVLVGILALSLFSLRLIMIHGKMNVENDPYKNSRAEFIINSTLLITLNTAVYWMFAAGIGPYGSNIQWILPILVIFTPLFGSLLLLQIVMGIQNLWWKTEKESESQRSESDIGKEILIEKIPDAAGKLFAEVILGLIIFNLAPIYLSATLDSAYVFYQFQSRMAGLFISIAFSGILLIFYFLVRYGMISKFDSKRIIGQRTRGEALIDAIVSSSILILAGVMFLLYSYTELEYNIPLYQAQLGSYLFAYTMTTLEFLQPILLCLGLLFRIVGDSMEFVKVWKRKAISWIKQSGILLIASITILIAIDYFKYIAFDAWYLQYEMMYWTFVPLVVFLCFQVSASSLKLKMIKEEDLSKKTIGPMEDVNHSIAN